MPIHNKWLTIVLPVCWATGGFVHAQSAPLTQVSERSRASDEIYTIQTVDGPVLDGSRYPRPGSDPVPLPMVDHAPGSTLAAPNCPCDKCCGMRERMQNRKTQRIAKLQESHWGYTQNTHVAPFGGSVNYALKAQAMYGVIESVTLYHYDFYPDDSENGAVLNPYGRERLRYIVAKASSVNTPIRIQATVANAELDQLRRYHVIAVAEEEGLEIDANSVVLLRFPRTNMGLESGVAFARRLENFGSQSSSAGGQQAGARGNTGIQLPAAR
jgi:hypothetical protein